MLLEVGDGTRPNIHAEKPCHNDDPGAPNEAYFQNVDAVMEIAREGEIAQAEARLEQARLDVAQIEGQIDGAQVRAPFAGTVSEVHARVGQVVLPGQTLIDLGDLGALRAETTDLSERDVVRVAVGQEATVFVEVLNVEIPGQVAGIAPEATTIGGDVVYEVVIELAEQLLDLRWGMSVEIEIDTR